MSKTVVVDGKLYKLGEDPTMGCEGCAFNTAPAKCTHPDVYTHLTIPCVIHGIFTEVKDEQCGVGNG